MYARRGLHLILAFVLVMPLAAQAAAGFDDGFFIADEDGAYLLKLRGYVQPRFALAVSEDAGGDGVEALGFRIRRGRVTVSGHVFTEALGYALQVDFARPQPLLDWFAEFGLGRGFTLVAGQTKIPYSRQFLASSSGLGLVERSQVTEAFTEKADLGPAGVALIDRDIGLSLHWGSQRLGVALGAFNGNGLNQTGNDDTDLTWAARAEWHPLGPVTDKEGAFAGAEPAFALAASAVLAPARGLGETLNLGADAVLWTGPAFLQAEVFYRQIRPAADEVRALGFYVQSGWLVLPGPRLALAARYGWLDRDLSNDVRHHEVALGPNLYLREHDLKVQANYVLTLEEGGAAGAEHAVLLQTTLAFK